MRKWIMSAWMVVITCSVIDHSFAKGRMVEPNQPYPIITPEMSALAARMNRALLDVGINVQVYPINTKGLISIKGGPYPSLVLFGYLNRVVVYQIAKATNLIPTAREVGFKSVEFNSKGSGLWLFDLTSPGQSCAQDLCF